ncbi:hypothetical protein BD779DRAFT_682985 [Infundibulicybe gibba]|nr:hypothetical protein BD779DRAFT_682985 [Infundibulicybe gibba]
MTCEKSSIWEFPFSKDANSGFVSTSDRIAANVVRLLSHSLALSRRFLRPLGFRRLFVLGFVVVGISFFPFRLVRLLESQTNNTLTRKSIMLPYLFIVAINILRLASRSLALSRCFHWFIGFRRPFAPGVAVFANVGFRLGTRVLGHRCFVRWINETI